MVGKKVCPQKRSPEKLFVLGPGDGGKAVIVFVDYSVVESFAFGGITLIIIVRWF